MLWDRRRSETHRKRERCRVEAAKEQTNCWSENNLSRWKKTPQMDVAWYMAHANTPCAAKIPFVDVFFFLANIQHDRPPMPSTTIVRRRPIAHRANITYLYSCWLVHFWSIKFYILPSGLNRKRLIMVRQCQNIKSGIYKDYFPFSFTEHGI